jgi:sigma-E factor negative regulatory protein RseB
VDARWTDGQGRLAPPPGTSWDLEIVRTREVAGREASIVVARDEDDHVRARFAVDRELGQLLRREVLDRHGRVVHSVGFVKIITGPIDPAVPATPKETPPAPESLGDAPGGYLAPDSIDGYRLLGVYEHPDGMVQMYYGDGLFTLSLFEQSGSVDWESLPSGDARVADVRDRSYVTAVGTVVVWQHGELVCTLVGDGPRDSVTDAAAGLAGFTDESWLDDVADFLLGPFSWK